MALFMHLIKQKWRSITLTYLIGVYLLTVVALKQPLSLYFILISIYFLLFILLFLGTTVGIIGIVLQLITRKESIVDPFYQLAYRLGTMNTTILASYGLILLRQNKALLGKACFERALTTTTYFLTRKTLLGNIAIAYWKMGDIDGAIAQYKDILKTYSKSDPSYQEDMGLTEEGIQALVDDNPYMYTQDYTTLGYMYILKENEALATFYTLCALKLNDQYAAAYDNLGQIDYYKHNLAVAKSHFEKALALNKKLPDSLYFMGMIEHKNNHPEVARDYLKQAMNCKLDGLNTITYEMINEAMKAL